MTSETANEAVKSLIAAIQEDLQTLTSEAELAATDIADGSRNGAIGALSSTDNIIERVAASLTAARAIHRAARD